MGDPLERGGHEVEVHAEEDVLHGEVGGEGGDLHCLGLWMVTFGDAVASFVFCLVVFYV